MPGQTAIDEIVVYVTASSEGEAAEIAKSLVTSKLAACASIIGNVRSIYSWQGKVEDAREVLMIIKTQNALFNALAARVKELHSYDVPEIIAIPVAAGSEDYLQWLRDSTGN